MKNIFLACALLVSTNAFALEANYTSRLNFPDRHTDQGAQLLSSTVRTAANKADACLVAAKSHNSAKAKERCFDFINYRYTDGGHYIQAITYFSKTTNDFYASVAVSQAEAMEKWIKKIDEASNFVEHWDYK